MTQPNASPGSQANYRKNLQEALQAWPSVNAAPASAVAPGVADVMHGIGEDSGALLLTATIGLSYAVSAWPIAGSDMRIRFIAESGGGPGHDFSLPMKLLAASPDKIIQACQAADRAWAIPTAQVTAQAMAEGIFPKPRQGLAVLIQTDFPPDADWGRRTVLAAASLSALCRLHGATPDVLTKAQICSDAVDAWTGLRSVRTALTSLVGPADGSLLQIQPCPRWSYEPLPMPPGIMIQPIRTRLSREVRLERLVETRLCVEMAQQVLDALPASGENVTARRLAAITPTEYVDGFKNVFPQKITGQEFEQQFGPLRGLNGGLPAQDVYKVRSRAEHHIYEQPRVTQFISALARARRAAPNEPMTEAGELLYASHWSHSQRCGIGGVEADRIVTFIRRRGPDNGLFGAKVTGGGDGGEMIVLMRNDPQAHQALAAALADARSASNRMVHLFHGCLPGAELAVANF